MQNYESFAADFGPPALTEVVKFCKHLDGKLADPLISKSRPVIFHSGVDPKVVTNTVFLLCCYLVMRQGFSPGQAVERFETISGLPIIYFCDARPASGSTDCKHQISIMDCLMGLTKAIRRGLWAEESFDVQAAEWLYSSENFDLSVVIPKFIAFACPNTIHGGKLRYIRRPGKYMELFKHMGVTDIVRLNSEETYSHEEFREAGFKYHDLSFPDCSCPSLDILERFMDLCDKAKGRVAVHCLAGLGRTGTLICCDLIKNYGFTAFEAVGYIRLTRPGSVIDIQHDFLRMVEDFGWDGNRPLVPDSLKIALSKRFRTSALVAGPIRVPFSSPPSTSHSSTVMSSIPEAIVLPFRDHATEFTTSHHPSAKSAHQSLRVRRASAWQRVWQRVWKHVRLGGLHRWTSGPCTEWW